LGYLLLLFSLVRLFEALGAHEVGVMRPEEGFAVVAEDGSVVVVLRFHLVEVADVVE
jgi:hypothetical protein